MKQKGIISTYQFVWMIFNIIASFTTLHIPGLLIYHAGRDAWLSIICAWFLDVVLALVYAYMGLRFPGQNMIQYSITILGKYVGKIVGIMFCLFFLMISSVLMRSLAGLISNVFLVNTPMVVILGMSYLVIAYGIQKGIEAIARTCGFLGPIYLFSMIVMFVLLIPKVRLHRLIPILYKGFYPAFTGTPFLLSFFGICIIMGMYIPICNKPANGFLAKLIAVSIGALVLGILVFFGVGIFGGERAGNLINLGISLARMIRIGNFFERLEIFWFVIVVAAGIMTSTNLIWAFSLGISQIAGLSTYKHLVYPSVLVAFVLSVTSFKNTIEVFGFIFYSFMFIGVFVETGLELLLFFTALITGKKG